MIECKERLGTHRCCQINDHPTHYCACTGDDNHRWKTGEGRFAKLSDYQPHMCNNDEIIVEMLQRGVIPRRKGATT